MVKEDYSMNDMKQAALGATVASLFFYMLRSGNPINIDPTKGLIVGLIWIYIVSSPFLTNKSITKIHSIGNIIISIIVCSTLALIFDMVTMEQLLSFQFFGTAAWLGVLLALPTSHFFDKMDIRNMYTRWYYKKR